MPENSNKETPSALVLRTLTREGGHIVCRSYVVTGSLALTVFTPPVLPRWRARAILLTEDDDQEELTWR